MTQDVELRERLPAALLWAAATTLWLVRALPLRFDYVGNDLGIVSFASLNRYPQQQESFWLIFSACSLLVFGAGFARLARALAGPLQRLASELLGVMALLAPLLLPLEIALAASVLLVVLFAGLLLRSARQRAAGVDGAPFGASTGSGATPGGGPTPPLRSRRQQIATVLAALALAALVTPALPVAVWRVSNGAEDLARVSSDFRFQGEIGQHLAWANALRRGERHGRDFFCLYGPLYDLSTLLAWKVFGRSIAAWDLLFASGRVLGMCALLLLTAALTRRPVWMLAAPFLVPWTGLRIGLALFALLALRRWLVGRHAGWACAAGFLGGISLFYSQEFGLAFWVCAALAFGLAGRAGAAAWALAGAVLVALPLLGSYALDGALLPMLRDLAGYPAAVVAGYAKLPFPALAAALPFDLADWGSREWIAFGYGHLVPAVCAAALCIALPSAVLDARRPVAAARALRAALLADPERCFLLLVALFGALVFRSALGRSDLVHMIATLPVAVALSLAGLAHCAELAWRGGSQRPLALVRVALLAGALVFAGFERAPHPLRDADRFLRALVQSSAAQPPSRADSFEARMVRWIRAHTAEGEAVLFLPNNAAYYYLSDRPNPIRFVMGHQIVTQAHRDEVLATLRRRPPRYLVWDEAALRVDRIPDERVFGAELMRWLESSYTPRRRFGALELREFSAPEADPAAGRGAPAARLRADGRPPPQPAPLRDRTLDR